STPRKPAPMKSARACCRITSNTASPRRAWMSVRNAFTPASACTDPASGSETVGERGAPGVSFVGAGVLHPLAVAGIEAQLPWREDADHQHGTDVIGSPPRGEGLVALAPEPRLQRQPDIVADAEVAESGQCVAAVVVRRVVAVAR